MRKLAFYTLIVTLLCPVLLRAQAVDSVDVTDYDITLDLSDDAPFKGYAVITMQLVRPCESISLDLLGVADSVEMAGVRSYNASLEALPTAGISVGQPFTVKVWYTCPGYVESYGLGGFHFDNDMSYNIGVGFDTDPHVIGRAFYPCRDNFTDKATYTLRVTATPGWTAECGGMLQSRTVGADGKERSVWRIDQPTPTYLVSVSQAAWKRIYDTIHSLYGDYPVTYGYLYPDSMQVRQAFAQLDSVVPMYERCFGPYRWGRIGYIATNRGSMEHVNNIGLAKQILTTPGELAQSNIAHELGHAWFGNLVTCSDAGDMWINEGGASFTEEVAMEAVNGRAASDDYYQRSLEKVLRTTHITDSGYRALHDIPHQYTYGSTVYQKGWMVWHSLRGYLGEELFYSTIRQLMDRCAFGNLDAWQIRDSLSLYSGVNLDDFFDFHVFSPGFVDYHAELSGNFLTVRAQSVGTTQMPTSHRVPVTIYSRNDNGELDSAKICVAFTGSETTVNLVTEPLFCVLDRDFEFSDAATLGYRQLTGNNTRYTLKEEHMMASSPTEMPFYVEHHMAPAQGEMPEGVVRRANRYWMVRCAENEGMKGRFRYIRTGYSETDFPELDRGFYRKTSTLDSMALFYRRNSESPWKFVSKTHTGGTNDGWMVAEELKPGEYTLAVVDFSRLAIERPESAEKQLFPNPLHPGQPLTVEVETEAPFEVTIFDEGGRQVWQKKGCRNGQKLTLGLTKGTYFVKIENNFISLHSKLIQL